MSSPGSLNAALLSLRELGLGGNQTMSPLLRLPAELRNAIYILASTDITLMRRKPHFHCSNLPAADWNRSFRVENSNKGLSQTCRQLRHELTGFNPQPPSTLILPFSVDLEFLAHIVGLRDCANIQTLKIGNGLARRFRSIAFGTNRRRLIDDWADKVFLNRVFRSLKLVSIRKVWWKLESGTVVAVTTCFGKSELRVEFC